MLTWSKTIRISKAAEQRIEERLEEQKAKRKRQRTKKPSLNVEIEMNEKLLASTREFLSKHQTS